MMRRNKIFNGGYRYKNPLKEKLKGGKGNITTTVLSHLTTTPFHKESVKSPILKVYIS